MHGARSPLASPSAAHLLQFLLVARGKVDRAGSGHGTRDAADAGVQAGVQRGARPPGLQAAAVGEQHARERAESFAATLNWRLDKCT